MYPYVIACTPMWSYVPVCNRMYPYVIVCTRVYSYVTRVLFSQDRRMSVRAHTSFQSVRTCRCKSEYQRLFSFLSVLFFHVGPVGLDWNKLKETLNPKFDWDAAVQAALKTDDSLEEVWFVSVALLPDNETCVKFVFGLILICFSLGQINTNK